MSSPCVSCPAFATAAPLTAARTARAALTRRPRRPMCVAAPPRRAALPTPPPAPNFVAGLAADISTAAEFVAVQAAAAAGERVVYVLFHAGYCRACKAVLPKFRALAASYPSAAFVAVRLEEGRELAARLGIRSVPTVQIYRGVLGKVDEFPCGPASVPRLRETVHELSGVDAEDGCGELVMQ